MLPRPQHLILPTPAPPIACTQLTEFDSMETVARLRDSGADCWTCGPSGAGGDPRRLAELHGCPTASSESCQGCRRPQAYLSNCLKPKDPSLRLIVKLPCQRLLLCICLHEDMKTEVRICQAAAAGHNPACNSCPKPRPLSPACEGTACLPCPQHHACPQKLQGTQLMESGLLGDSYMAQGFWS